MVADVAMQDRGAAEVEAADPTPASRHWELLGRLEKTAIGARQPDGSVSVRRAEAAGCVLYGPYVHLPKGHYRLSFRCSCGAPRMSAQPLLGIEIIVLSRFQRQWHDFTAVELSAGGASLDFEVPYEHSLESDNEGRFEFRFFHLGNADLTISAVTLDALSPSEAPSKAVASRWRLLGRLEKSWLGRRGDDGSVSVGWYDLAGRLLYGAWPYLRLPRGCYRVQLRGHLSQPVLPGRPVLAVEVLGQSRWLSRRQAMLLARLPETNGEQLAWRDIAAGEFEAGSAAVDFIVPTEMSMEAGADAPFDVRLHHFGGAGLTIDAIDLIKLDEKGAPSAAPGIWHLLSGPVAETSDRGDVRIGQPSYRTLLNRRAPLRFPPGRYRLKLAGDVREGADPRSLLLQVDLAAWPLLAGVRRFNLRAPPISGRAITAVDPNSGSASVEFEAPAAAALGDGGWRCELTVYGLGNDGFRLSAIDIYRIGDDELPADSAAASTPTPARSHRTGRRKVVIVGNCQSETLRQGFARSETLNRLFDVKYHFIQLPKNLHEFAARDLESCDILLYQDIRLWDEFPLRDCVRPGADMAPFPLVRFASLWPFDSWNGPGDKEAYDREAPNLTFPYLDGLLGRARKEIPDPEARFLAYRSLEMPGVVNYRRLHEMEVRRLAGIDQKFNFAIGSFILENFQNRRVFHTTVRPNWEVFTLLMQFVARQVGVTEPISLGEGVDASLRDPQVPIHPKVAADLGVKWVDETTRYVNRGIVITWEAYVRSYIEHYG